MRTTADCKQFLVDFFKDTPNLIIEIYGKPDGDTAHSYALNAKNWKRELKCKPGSENSYINGSEANVYEKGKLYPRGPNYDSGIPIRTSDIAVERHFCLKEDELDSAVRFIVIETHSGEFFLGEYIGD